MRARPRWSRIAGALAAVTLLPLSACGFAAGDDTAAVHVYSARSYGAEQAYQRFSDETGIEVEFLNGSDAELRERLQAEGADSKADVFMTVDVANLSLAADQQLLAPTPSPVLDGAVPASLRDPQGRWYGLSQRARPVLFNPTKVKPEDVPTYASLADPRWKGRICLRTSTSAYTQSLVASFLAHRGPAEAKKVVLGWMANEPQILANDIEIVRTIAAGGCDVGITNHYYVARELAANPSLQVGIAWPEQAATGVHVNISGAGLTRSADNPDGARRFLEWLATNGQSLFVDGNFEYPVNSSVPPTQALQRFGTFRADQLNVGRLGGFNAEAVRLLTDAGYR